MNYLLPCSCGRKLPVQLSQAGQRVHCDCGTDLDVPTMREIALLEHDRSEPVTVPAAPRRWGLRQQLLLAGAALVLVGVAFGGVRYYFRPVRAEVAVYTPRAALNLWMLLRQGIDRVPHPIEFMYQERLNSYRQAMAVAAAITVVGLLTMAGSVWVDRVLGRRRGPPGKPRR